MFVNTCSRCNTKYICNQIKNPTIAHLFYCSKCESTSNNIPPTPILLNIEHDDNPINMTDIFSKTTYLKSTGPLMNSNPFANVNLTVDANGGTDDNPAPKKKVKFSLPKKVMPNTDEPFEWIGPDVKTISDLIRLGKAYDSKKRIRSNLDMYRLSKLVTPLLELEDMVGLQNIKSSIFDQIIFHLQMLDDDNKDMHHTVIKGPPGVGKTQLTHIIAKIYKAIGFLKTDTVLHIKVDDLVAGYVGQTAIKTRKLLESALGGVLLIDEAYSLGDKEGKDSFKKDAIDLLTSFLSEHGHEFICIIAGYKDALEKQFFTMNEGLARRFSIHYDIEPYSPADMVAIFRKTVSSHSWSLDDSPDVLARLLELFNDNKAAFPNYGGDCLNMFTSCKKVHAKRLLTIKTEPDLEKAKKCLTLDDINAGYTLYYSINGYAKTDSSKDIPTHIYC